MGLSVEFLKEYDDASIYWVGGFHKKYIKGKNGRTDSIWTVKVYFKCNKVKGQVPKYPIQYRLLPAEYFPALVLGACYKKGLPVGGNSSADIIKNLIIKDLSEISFIELHKLPYSLHQYYGNNELKDELVCVYETTKKIYYIPQMELIRTLLAYNSTFVTFMLEPGGLDRITAPEVCEEDNVIKYYMLRLSDDIPNRLATKSNVAHLASIVFDTEFSNLWHSVYFRLTTDSDEYKDNPNQFFTPSKLKDLKLRYFGQELQAKTDANGNKLKAKVFVQQITGVSNLPYPSKDVKYSHKSIKERDPERKTMKYNNNRAEGNLTENSDADIVNAGISKNSSNATIYRPADAMVSRQYRKKSVNKIQKVATPNKSARALSDDNTAGRHSRTGNKKRNKYASNLPLSDAAVDALVIDTSTLKDDFNINTYGLELFLLSICNFLKIPKHLIICDYFHKKNDSKEKSEWVYVYTHYLGSIIIEASRPTNKESLSTLIIGNLSVKVFQDYHQEDLCRGVVENNKHWNEFELRKRFKDGFIKLPHVEPNSDNLKFKAMRWAARIHRACLEL